MKITPNMAIELASHEALIRQAYKDSVGVLTWSIGITSMSGHKVDRYIDKPQSPEHCLEIYVWALEKYAKAVRIAFEGHDLTEAQFAAALSFHYNTGAINKAAWVKHWKAGRIAKARQAFMSWKRPKEIIPRRMKERDLFFDGKWSNKGTIPEYTKVTKNLSPVWSSRVNIPAKDVFEKLLSDNPNQPLDHVPAPPAQEVPEKIGLFARLFGSFWRTRK